MLYDRELTEEEYKKIQNTFKKVFNEIKIEELEDYDLRRYLIMKILISISDDYSFDSTNRLLLSAMYGDFWTDLEGLIKNILPFKKQYHCQLWISYKGYKFRLLRYTDKKLEFNIQENLLSYEESCIGINFLINFINSNKPISKDELYEIKSLILDKMEEKINLFGIKKTEKEEIKRIKEENNEESKKNAKEFLKKL